MAVQPPPPPPPSPSSGASSESRVFGLIAWLLGIIGAIIALVLKPNDRFVKFHAMQSLLLHCPDDFHRLLPDQRIPC